MKYPKIKYDKKLLESKNGNTKDLWKIIKTK